MNEFMTFVNCAVYEEGWVGLNERGMILMSHLRHGLGPAIDLPCGLAYLFPRLQVSSHKFGHQKDVLKGAIVETYGYCHMWCT